MLRELLIPTVAAVLGSLLTAAIIGLINAPETPRITATYNRVEIPNPVNYFWLRDDKAKDFLSKLPSSIPIAVFEKVVRESELTLVWIKITNPTSRRSAAIEVSLSHVALWHIKRKNSTYSVQDKLSFDSIDPLETIEILAVSTRSRFFIGWPTILENGRILPFSMQIEGPDEDPLGLIRILVSRPYLGWVFLFSFIISLSAVIIMLFDLYLQTNIRVRARLTTRNDIQKMQQLLEYMRQNHPERVSN